MLALCSTYSTNSIIEVFWALSLHSGDSKKEVSFVLNNSFVCILSLNQRKIIFVLVDTADS